jgi:O-antigen/teichoic acid export membrane protein
MAILMLDSFKLNDETSYIKSKSIFVNASILSVTSKVLQLSSHALTLILISNFFSLKEQGLFFLFHSLISLQIFVELGMGNVIQNFSSHEAEKIRSSTNIKTIKFKAATDRLGYIFRIGLIWFGFGGVLLTFILVLLGTEFIEATKPDYEGWKLIWFITGLLVSILISFQVFWSIIQGCNWVIGYHKFKIIQIFAGNLALWTVMLSGGKLWSIVAFIGIQVVVAIMYLLLRYRAFFYDLFKLKLINNNLSWRKDLLPFQSLIFISFLSGYLAYNIQVPMTSLLFGVEEAGKVGASWQLAGLVSMISIAFISPHAPQIAMWAQARKYNNIKPYFNRLLINNTFITIVLSLLLLLSIDFGKTLEHPIFFVNIMERLGDMLLISLMIFGQVILALISPLSIYFRAHKKEPIAHISLLCGLITLISSYYLCLQFGVIGIGLGFVIANLIIFPLVILRYKKEKFNYENN